MIRTIIDVFLCLNISHLTLHDKTIFKEARRLKRMNLCSRVFTRKGVVSMILLNDDERIASDAGELF
jgi:hypothetical protein